MTGEVVPFGKYKGQPVEALAQDRQYVDWLTAQPWFKERFGNIYTLIVNNFQEPSETPEHNALQTRFLEPAFRADFVRLLNRDYVGNGSELRVEFEIEGFDVHVSGARHWEVYVECKPSVADDYPAVLRQIKAAKHAPIVHMQGRPWHEPRDRNACLLLESYCGIGANEAQFRAIFKASEIAVVFVREIVQRPQLDDFFKEST